MIAENTDVLDDVDCVSGIDPSWNWSETMDEWQAMLVMLIPFMILLAWSSP